jgi:hypothetical protein
LRSALLTAWGRPLATTDWPRDLTAQLARDKYARGDWT